MAKFEVTLQETITKRVTVEAPTEKAALEKVEGKLRSGQLIFSREDFSGIEMKAQWLPPKQPKRTERRER